MPRKKNIRENIDGFQHSNHEVLDVKEKIFRVPTSGDAWQFSTWIREEKKYLRRTLKTKDLETALQRGEDWYLQTFSDMKPGRKMFGITLNELSDAYIKWRQDDVVLGTINKNRVVTIKSHLKHFLSYKGHQTRLAELGRNSCYEYELWWLKENPTTKKASIRNEQATFNHIDEICISSRSNTY